MTKPDKEVHEPLGTNFKRSHIDIYIYTVTHTFSYTTDSSRRANGRTDTYWQK